SSLESPLAMSRKTMKCSAVGSFAVTGIERNDGRHSARHFFVAQAARFPLPKRRRALIGPLPPSFCLVPGRLPASCSWCGPADLGCPSPSLVAPSWVPLILGADRPLSARRCFPVAKPAPAGRPSPWVRSSDPPLLSTRVG